VKLDYDLQQLDTPGLKIAYYVVPWDGEIFRFPVAQIEHIDIRDAAAARRDYGAFKAWLVERDVRLVSCRLGHDRLRESMFLEDRGFRFVEMVYPLRLGDVHELQIPQAGIEFHPAGAADLNEMQDIAREAFGTGRLNVDPRLGPELGGRRYAAWVSNSLEHPTQRVYKAVLDGRVAAFFVIEILRGERVYWHLSAVAPAFQGRGVGKRAWRAMIALNQRQGARIIETVIAARNTPVVNLYVDLQFRFMPPLMTFHWWRT
jgi:ribosomal protein S18 acetylase RimI-like enzyme